MALASPSPGGMFSGVGLVVMALVFAGCAFGFVAFFQGAAGRYFVFGFEAGNVLAGDVFLDELLNTV